MLNIIYIYNIRQAKCSLILMFVHVYLKISWGEYASPSVSKISSCYFSDADYESELNFSKSHYGGAVRPLRNWRYDST